MAGYAIISLGGKQYRVEEGQKLLVDRLPQDEGNTISPTILLVGGDGAPDLSPQSVTVQARVVRHVLGKKVRIGKYKPKSGYKRHTGYRSRLSQIEIEAIGKRSGGAKAAERKPTPEAPDETREQRPPGMPKGYEELTVAAIAEAAPGWRRPMLEAALEYERAHADRKGAVAALESALEAKED